MNAMTITKVVAAVCPILGVSIGRLTDKSTWRIDFRPEATVAQRLAAQAAIDGFDLNAALNPTRDVIAGESIDGLDRLWFEVNFDQENRVRVFEGKAAITRAVYRDALITRWKALNP